MSRFVGLAMAGVLVLGVACLAHAQPGDGPRRGRGPGPGMTDPGGGMLRLLRIEAVQKELELVDDQKAKLRELADELGGGRPPAGETENLSREERRARMEEWRKEAGQRQGELMKKVEAILLPQQVTRLKEIQLQILGAQALDNPAVAQKLNLTELQKEKLTAVVNEIKAQRARQFEGWQDLSQEERREKMQQSRKENEEKLLSVLTEEQKSQFEAMKGQKLDIDPAQLFGGRGGPAGEGRPGREDRRPRRDRQPAETP